MLALLPLLICLLWFGPAAALLFVALVLEQRRDAPNGTDPGGNIVLRCLVGGIAAAGGWALIGALADTALWLTFTPWAFALGEAIALFMRKPRPVQGD